VSDGTFWLPAAPDSGIEPGSRRLLAYGANRSADGLARKLGDPSPPVAAVHGWLRDFDVVYSAHLSPYGAVPATLQASPGTEVSVHVLCLDDRQLAAIDAAEPNYELVVLDDLWIELDSGARHFEAVEAYLSRHGCLNVEGAERALAAIRARGRTLAACEHQAMLAAVRDRLAPGEDLESFILDGVDDPSVQRARTNRLRADALAFVRRR
jgi:hypothetical protein